jgi:ribulose 1,5-bisphosphate synthetase/thiazole synthase
MGNQKKIYDSPQDAIKDLTTIGGSAIINKTLNKKVKEKIKKKAEKWVAAVPGGKKLLTAAERMKEKGFYIDIDPFKKKIEAGWKFTFGGKD